MKAYKVTITETRKIDVVVNADNEDEARKNVREAWLEGTYDKKLDGAYATDVHYTTSEVN